MPSGARKPMLASCSTTSISNAASSGTSNGPLAAERVVRNQEDINMGVNSTLTKMADLLSKIIENVMIVSGIIALVWILAFLLVGMADK